MEINVDVKTNNNKEGNASALRAGRTQKRLGMGLRTLVRTDHGRLLQLDAENWNWVLDLSPLLIPPTGMLAGSAAMVLSLPF